MFAVSITGPRVDVPPSLCAAQGHGKPGYTVGLDPASPGNSRPSSRAGSRSASRTGSRSASPFRHDTFFQRGTAGSQEREQLEATMRQVGTAQDATYEADLERAMRRSKRDEEERRRRAGESPSRERSDSHNRGMSRIRAAIKERESASSIFSCNEGSAESLPLPSCTQSGLHSVVQTTEASNCTVVNDPFWHRSSKAESEHQVRLDSLDE